MSSRDNKHERVVLKKRERERKRNEKKKTNEKKNKKKRKQRDTFEMNRNRGKIVAQGPVQMFLLQQGCGVQFRHGK